MASNVSVRKRRWLHKWLLNQEEEIAFLISAGHKKWIAKKEHIITADIVTQKFGGEHDFVIPNFAEYNLNCWS